MKRSTAPTSGYTPDEYKAACVRGVSIEIDDAIALLITRSFQTPADTIKNLHDLIGYLDQARWYLRQYSKPESSGANQQAA